METKAREAKVETLFFHELSDERGSLVALEQYKNIPFEIKRVYYIFHNDSKKRRGFHAHKQLEQVLVCMNGSCKVFVDDGNSKDTVLLDHPSKGLYIGNMIWREMYDFSSDCVLMVLASDYYVESDYIRDYHLFLEKMKTGGFL